MHLTPEQPAYSRIAPDVKLGQRVRVHAFVNLYGSKLATMCALAPLWKSKGRADRQSMQDF